MKHLHEVFSHFSLSEIESNIYQAVLSLDKPSVSQIAKKIDKHRTAVYFHINNLLTKGVLRESRRGGTQRFIATPPSELATQFDQWATEFKSLVPELESLKRLEYEYPVIQITESKRGYALVYDAISSLPVGSMFRVLEGADALANELTLLTQEQWQDFFQKIEKRKIQTKAIFTEESLALPPKKLSARNLQLLSNRVWHLKSLPEEILPFQKILFIYGSTVAFLFPETALVMIIRHAGITQALSVMFDGLYAIGKPIGAPWK